MGQIGLLNHVRNHVTIHVGIGVQNSVAISVQEQRVRAGQVLVVVGEVVDVEVLGPVGGGEIAEVLHFPPVGQVVVIAVEVGQARVAFHERGASRTCTHDLQVPAHCGSVTGQTRSEVLNRGARVVEAVVGDEPGR